MPADDRRRLHDDAVAGTPQHPAAERTIPVIKCQKLFVFLMLGADVEFDHHAQAVEIGPCPQQHQIGNIECDASGQPGGGMSELHWDLL